MADAPNSKIDVFVKTPKERKTINIDPKASIGEFKILVAEHFGAAVENLGLIFSGKVLKDEEKLDELGIKDGITVHLIIKMPKKVSPPQTTATPVSTAFPSVSSFQSFGNAPSGVSGVSGLLGDMGLGSGGFSEMQQRVQREVMMNPDLMRQMTDSPMVQNLMSNPDLMRSIITSSPQMEQLIERNPEVGHMLNNPDLMRQALEVARNPAMMQEMMRNQDRALSNLESMPGGFGALSRLYRDVQEPMMSGMQEHLGGNPFATLVSNTNSDAQQRGRENNDPLPNPWSPPTPASSTTLSSAASVIPSAPTSTPSVSADSANSRDMVRQMLSHTGYLQDLLASDGALNPQNRPRDSTTTTPSASSTEPSTPSPNVLQGLRTPEIWNALSNPLVVPALMKIKEGINELHAVAPALVAALNLTPFTAPTPAPSSTASSQSPEFLADLISQIGGGIAGQNAGRTPAPSVPTQSPSERFAPQLQQLASMGFTNRDANIHALTAAFGDVNGAIERLLGGGGLS